jgi:hypothetical protein
MALQRSDLNDFLFADVGTEANGMMLRVVSVLARGGSDPWQEAERLAALPAAAAGAALSSLISGMPLSPWSPADAALIADRLIRLLPSGTKRAGNAVAVAARSRKSLPVVVALLCLGVAVGYALSGVAQRTLGWGDQPDAAAMTDPGTRASR